MPQASRSWRELRHRPTGLNHPRAFVALRVPAEVSYSSQDLPHANAQDSSAGVCREKLDSCLCQFLLFSAGLFRVSSVT